MESLPLSGQHAARAMKLRGFPGGKAAFWAFPFGNISPAFEKAGQNGASDAALSEKRSSKNKFLLLLFLLTL